jgi:enoyl-CoA hydratase/carnithine racemase
MISQITDKPGAVIPYSAKAKNRDLEADQLDLAGSAILGLVDHAADIAETDLQEAREAAERLADQLRAAQNLINELEATVRYYQD